MLHSDNQYHGLFGIPDKLMMRSQFLRLGQMLLELIQFDEPPLLPGPALRPLNQLGLTHLSFRVTDIDMVSRELESLGGKILETTRTVVELPGTAPGKLIFCTDPDGTRIELMNFPEDVSFG